MQAHKLVRLCIACLFCVSNFTGVVRRSVIYCSGVAYMVQILKRNCITKFHCHMYTFMLFIDFG